MQAGFLDLASNLLDGFNESKMIVNQINPQQPPTESKPLALSDGNEALMLTMPKNIKAVLLQINDML